MIFKVDLAIDVPIYNVLYDNMGNGHLSEKINLHCGHLSDTISIDPKIYVDN
jgi:hypothetical protein